MGGGKPGLLFTFCVTKNLGKSLSESGVGHHSGSAPLPPLLLCPTAKLPSSPTPPHSSGGGLELGRGLSGALKGSLSKGGRLNTILSPKLWSLAGRGAEGSVEGGMRYGVPRGGPRTGVFVKQAYVQKVL